MARQEYTAAPLPQTSVAVTAPITNAGTPTAPTIGISAATSGAAGSMSAADKSKLDLMPVGGELKLGANVALNNVGYTTILSQVVAETGNFRIQAGISMQSSTATAQTARLRIRVNGTDVQGRYSWIGGNEFVSVEICARVTVLVANWTLAIVGLVGIGSVTALAFMPDGATIPASNVVWGS